MFVAALLRDAPRVCDGMIVIGHETVISSCLESVGGIDADLWCVWLPHRDLAVRCGVGRGHPALALRLFERCVPLFVRDWLQEDRELMVELPRRLSRHASPAGAISALVEPDAPGGCRKPQGVLVARVPPMTALDANSAPATAAGALSRHLPIPGRGSG